MILFAISLIKYSDYAIYGQGTTCKRVKMIVGGSLLPLKNEQYSNLSTRHLTIWLELLVGYNAKEFSSNGFKNLKVSIYC